MPQAVLEVRGEVVDSFAVRSHYAQPSGFEVGLLEHLLWFSNLLLIFVFLLTYLLTELQERLLAYY